MYRHKSDLPGFFAVIAAVALVVAIAYAVTVSVDCYTDSTALPAEQRIMYLRCAETGQLTTCGCLELAEGY